ncbi:pseudouridine synthase [Bacteroidetes bacterium UKL13-3]|jgi:tRNA pseudouridine38-40 synthase|nr:pseudouridine synthase [Bacteroidetes bacterium UKL13-3]HCP92682.1 tRNA pseudouridine(38-40) synthase TruA [Bacteroidota bacterium]
MRYLLQLAYKGTRYHGWQKQHNAISVQSVLEEKLSLIVGENIETLGCGRTDTGVHAKDFYAHFDSTKTLDLSRMVYKLNQLFPDDIVAINLKVVAPDFNARFDAISRTYEYWITQTPNPFLGELAWYQYGKLDIDQMNEAAQLLIGKKDFQSFSKVHTQVDNFICDLTFAHWDIQGEKLVFTITANRFLRNMVRAIVGTLMEVGKGKLSVQDVQDILESKNRCEAGQSVPAQGLFLTRIDYPNLPQLK